MHWNEEKEYGKGKFIIPGSTVLTQMRKIEAEKPKGFYIYENQNLNFVTLETPRKFHYRAISFENAKSQEVIDKVRFEVSKISTEARKPIVKIVLEGTLEKGFSSADISVSDIERQSQESLILRIDKSHLGNTEVLERREIVERLRQKQMSVDEMGLELLKKHLEDLEYSDINSIETLLTKLSEGDIEEARKLIL
jgi:hypothetical protein